MIWPGAGIRSYPSVKAGLGSLRFFALGSTAGGGFDLKSLRAWNFFTFFELRKSRGQAPAQFAKRHIRNRMKSVLPW
ncbi:MAG: hypothetical protein DMG05_09750 [Acidobacteria bacterium]|nr:MAG: hypothetical protein DMG05_09750 [Acidobacteriota bacterium]